MADAYGSPSSSFLSAVISAALTSGWPMGSPDPLQNRLQGGLNWPHWAQPTERAAPHPLQKRASVGFSFWRREQRIAKPLSGMLCPGCRRRQRASRRRKASGHEPAPGRADLGRLRELAVLHDRQQLGLVLQDGDVRERVTVH